MEEIVTFMGPRENAGPFTMPKKIREALDNHADYGRETGHFVHAVLCNDLAEAVCMADEVSLAHLRDIVKYVYNDLPSPCWRSKEAVKAWRERGGSRAALQDGTACLPDR